MAQQYCVLKQTLFQYKAMVVGLSSESITDYFDEISYYLSQGKVRGKILLDYYSYNRSDKRRFCEIDFDGKSFPINTIKRVNIENCMKAYLNYIYKEACIPDALLIK